MKERGLWSTGGLLISALGVHALITTWFYIASHVFGWGFYATRMVAAAIVSAAMIAFYTVKHVHSSQSEKTR